MSSSSHQATRLGGPQLTGDVQVRSSDRATFQVFSQTLLQASNVFRELLADAPTAPGPEGDRNRILQLEEDATTIAAILEALKRPPLSISSLPLALKCFRAAEKYSLPYSLFHLDELAFKNRDDQVFAFASFAVCAMAWSTKQWMLAEHAARFTHTFSQEALFEQANEIPGAYEALSALMATREERAYRIAAVVHVLPLDRLTCEACKKAHRNTVSAFTTAISVLFQRPYPNIAAVFDGTKPFSLANPALLVGCEHRTCRHSVESCKFSTAEMTSIEERLAKVPQTIRGSLFDLKRATLRSPMANVVHE